MKSLLTILWSLLEDFKRLQPGVKGLDRDYVTVKARIKNEGYGFVSIALPSFLKAIDHGLETGRLTTPPGFSRSPGLSLPKFLLGLTSHVFDAKTGLLHRDPDIHAIKCLREFLGLFKKLTLDDDRSLRNDTKAKAAFFDLEAAITDFRSNNFFDAVSSMILSMTPFDVIDFVQGRNGPGAVSEKILPNEKWKEISSGISSRDDALMVLGYDLESFLNDNHSPRSLPPCGVSRLVTVPKTSSSRRTITIEPAVLQFAQQALNEHLRDSISRCPILSLCIDLNSQVPNQIWALEGSISRCYSTIDLSSASDLLSLSIVNHCFRKFPNFRNALHRSRSSYVTGNTSKLKKFAGMGNATTFPIQSVVFAVIAIAADLEARRVKLSYKEVLRSARRVRVFGDDIIVHSDSYHLAVSRLSDCGLRVNNLKTFHEGFFRESCGVDCYKGVHVTPLYLKHLPGSSMTPQSIENFIAVSNHSWLKGLYTFSTAPLRIVEKGVSKTLPYVRKDSGLLGWNTRRDDYSVSYWDSDLQRFQVKTLSRNPKYRKDEIDGYSALLKFYHTPLIQRNDKHLERSHRRFSLNHRWKRVHV